MSCQILFCLVISLFRLVNLPMPTQLKTTTRWSIHYWDLTCLCYINRTVTSLGWRQHISFPPCYSVLPKKHNPDNGNVLLTSTCCANSSANCGAVSGCGCNGVQSHARFRCKSTGSSHSLLVFMRRYLLQTRDGLAKSLTEFYAADAFYCVGPTDTMQYYVEIMLRKTNIWKTLPYLYSFLSHVKH